MPARDVMPSTIKRSLPKAQRTWAKTHDNAVRAGRGETFGGVDYYGHSREELYARAKKLGVSGRSSMTKKELAKAIARKQS
jgi:hypothetical protein